MNAFFRAIQRWLEDFGAPTPSSPTTNVRRLVVPASRVYRRTGSRIFVNRIPRPYWQERGWRQEGGTYRGNFQTRFGNWAGYVTESPGGRVEVFIHNPPSILERHPHWNCFSNRGGGWFFVHPATRVADVAAGIIGVEKTINEAYAI